MNVITRRIWDSDSNVPKWSKKNGFSPGYVHLVITGKRGSLYSGKAKDIISALKTQGFMTQDEVDERIEKSREV